MSDPRIEKWARTLVTYSVAVKPGQTVAISAGVAAEPLIRAIYREVVKAGGCPIVLPTFSGLAADLLNNGSDEQLSYISPVERFMREQTDVMIAIMADTNTKAMASVDPARQQFFSGARRELFDTYMQRSADGSLNWTLTLFPTNAYAQDADMSTEDFEEFVFRAGKLHTDDPVAAWKAETEFAQKIVDWLDGKKEIHLTGPGTDLTVDVTDRIWINSGDATKNFPDGEVFTGPVETGVNGTVSFSFPVVTAGREIEGIVLTFEQGKVVKATATRGQEYLEAVLDTDEGARYLGEFAIGTNFDIQRFSKNILFDEKIGGTVHMAIGAGYPETGNTNKSAVHWDMICDLRKGGEVRADGELLLKDGTFVV